MHLGAGLKKARPPRAWSAAQQPPRTYVPRAGFRGCKRDGLPVEPPPSFLVYRVEHAPHAPPATARLAGQASHAELQVRLEPATALTPAATGHGRCVAGVPTAHGAL